MICKKAKYTGQVGKAATKHGRRLLRPGILPLPPVVPEGHLNRPKGGDFTRPGAGFHPPKADFTGPKVRFHRRCRLSRHLLRLSKNCHCEPARRLVWQSPNFFGRFSSYFPSNRGIPTPVCALARNDTYFFDTLRRCRLSRHLLISTRSPLPAAGSGRCWPGHR